MECNLLGRSERVTAPTALLPTVMESADGPSGGIAASTGGPCSQAFALGFTPCNGAPLAALDARVRG